MFNIISSDFNLDILNIDFKYVNTSKVIRFAAANKINIIVPKRAAGDLCFHVSGVKFWNSLPNHIMSILNFKSFMSSLHSYFISLQLFNIIIFLFIVDAFMSFLHLRTFVSVHYYNM